MVEMVYLDFDLLIERSETGHRARVLNSPAGQASADLASSLSEINTEQFLAGIGRPQRGIPRDARRESPRATDAGSAITTLGIRLFEAVFAGEVGTCLRRSLDEAHRQETGLRIRLRLTDVPELADLPWEYLYDPTVGDFVTLSVETPLVRYLDLPQRIQPLAVQPPLRILVVIASPTDYVHLDADEEWLALQQALSDLEQRGRITLERLEEATIPALQQRLRRGDYNVFHFIGHGTFDDQRQEGVLLMEDEARRGRPMSTQFLGTLLRDERRTLRLVILNACKGARTSRADPFTGLAQGLVQKGIPAVIAMQFEITDEAAITFAQEFYRAVADGYPVDAALAEARKAIYLQGNEVDWATPVLYMRSPDGRLFDIVVAREEPAPRAEAPPATEQPANAIRVRPAPGGVSVSHYIGNSAVTLGCLVVDRADRSRMYILSDPYGICSPIGPSQAGDPILQPGTADGGSADDIIATLSRWTTVRDDDTSAAGNVLAALAEVNRLEDVSPEIRGRGMLRGVRQARAGMRVFLVGRTSGEISGTVLRVGGQMMVQVDQRHLIDGPVRGTGGRYGHSIPFADLIVCTEMEKPGDGGAILADEENYAIGLAFAGGAGVALFFPIQKVLDALNVDLVTESVWNEIQRSGEDTTAELQQRYARELNTILEAMQRQQLVLFIGADLPESVTGLPGRQSLADALATREGIAAGQRLASVTQQVMSHGNRWDFTNFLVQTLEPAGVQPGPVYQKLAQLINVTRPELIITTAYHRLLELAVQNLGDFVFNTVVRDSDLPFADPNRPTLLKLYGDLQQVDTLVVTEQDHSALLRGRDRPDMVDEVRRAFRRNSVLFLGYDLSDPAVGALFDEVAGDRFQIRSHAVWSGLSQPEMESFESNRGLTVLNTDPVAFVQALLDQT